MPRTSVPSFMMWLQLRKMALVGLMLVGISTEALCCPENMVWERYSSISFTTAASGNLTIKRFSDGLYARIESGDTTKEMYQLPRGIYLFKGYDPSKGAGPSPFFMLDMPSGIVLSLLAGYFPKPCAVPTRPTAFTYVNSNMGSGKLDVAGTAYLKEPATVVFDLSAVEQRVPGWSVQASGAAKFLDLRPIPADTAIDGWVVSRGFLRDAQVIERPTAITTIADLTAFIQAK